MMEIVTFLFFIATVVFFIAVTIGLCALAFLIARWVWLEATETFKKEEDK